MSDPVIELLELPVPAIDLGGQGLGLVAPTTNLVEGEAGLGQFAVEVLDRAVGAQAEVGGSQGHQIGHHAGIGSEQFGKRRGRQPGVGVGRPAAVGEHPPPGVIHEDDRRVGEPTRHGVDHGLERVGPLGLLQAGEHGQAGPEPEAEVVAGSEQDQLLQTHGDLSGG